MEGQERQVRAQINQQGGANCWDQRKGEEVDGTFSFALDLYEVSGGAMAGGN